MKLAYTLRVVNQDLVSLDGLLHLLVSEVRHTDGAVYRRNDFAKRTAGGIQYAIKVPIDDRVEHARHRLMLHLSEGIEKRCVLMQQELLPCALYRPSRHKIVPGNVVHIGCWIVLKPVSNERNNRLHLLLLGGIKVLINISHQHKPRRVLISIEARCDLSLSMIVLNGCLVLSSFGIEIPLDKIYPAGIFQGAQ